VGGKQRKIKSIVFTPGCSGGVKRCWARWISSFRQAIFAGRYLCALRHGYRADGGLSRALWGLFPLMAGGESSR
jgi:hypothetical protein